MAEAESSAPPAGPPLRELVVRVVSACMDRKGLSFYALKMALASEGYDYKLHLLKRCVMCLVRHGELVQDNKCGLSGRFKAPKPDKKKAAEAKEPKVKVKGEPREPKKKAKKPRKPKNAVVVTLE